MKTEIKTPNHDYPYLAIWTGGDNLTEKQIAETVKVEDVYVITKDGDDISAHRLTHHDSGEIKNESDYQRLPSGTQIILTQR